MRKLNEPLATGDFRQPLAHSPINSNLTKPPIFLTNDGNAELLIGSCMVEGRGVRGNGCGLSFNFNGVFSIHQDGNIWRPGSLKAQAIIAYLALSKNKTATREKLAGLLWSESDPDSARVSLRQVLSKTRKEAEARDCDILQADRQSVTLIWDNTALDIYSLQDELAKGQTPEVLITQKRYYDDMLTNLADVDPAFSFWLQVERQSLQESTQTRLGTIANKKGGSEDAVRAAKALLNLDATNEEACRLLMKEWSAKGELGQALRVYSELWDVLGADFDMEPGLATQQLVAKIKSDDETLVEKIEPEVIKVDENPIYILVHPYSKEDLVGVNIARVRGFRQELITAMTQFKDWSVREYLPFVETFSGSSEKTYEIILAIIAEQDVVNIIITLRRKVDGHYIWSRSSEIEKSNWFSVKQKIIRSIAQALDVQISGERLAQCSRANVAEIDIHDRWLQANNLLFFWEAEKEKQAEEILRKIITDNPDYAPANAGLAQVLNSRHLVYPGTMRDKRRESEALQLARKAAQIAPMDNRTQLTLAWSYLLNGFYEQAELYYQAAVKRNSIDPWTLCSAAQGLSYCGQHEIALELADSAVDFEFGIEPIHWAYQGFIRYLSRQYSQAINAVQCSRGSAIFIEGILAASYFRLGEYKLANEASDEFYRKIKNNWYSKEPPTRQNVLLWFSQAFPIRLDADRLHVREGLALSGLLNGE
ncbi:MAG: hypothetical protein GY748_17070 [Planctomycetaceae bacterium]|nr:hypothetical protein [Planctomycetaceae bacterium]